MTTTSPTIVEIIEYDPKYEKDFARINYEWLEAFFTIEQHDRDQLEAPYEAIIKPGGQIFFALVKGKVAGTVGLQPKGEASFELIKMGVSPEYKGLKIGKKLVEAAILYTRKIGKKSIVLGSNTRLEAALHIYQSAGFKVTAPDPHSPYHRCDIWMELPI